MSDPVACDDQRLLSILRDGLSNDAADEAAVHLESCDYCQERLQQLAASAEILDAGIFIFLSGGLAQHESFDMKPDAAEEIQPYRSRPDPARELPCGRP